MTRLTRTDDPSGAPGEAVTVRRHDEDPAQFLWRGRLYVVQEVLARWTEAGGWWRGSAVQALALGGEAGETGPVAERAPLETAPLPSSPKWAQRAWGEPAPDVGVSTGPAHVQDGERDWWRVEAGRGVAFGTGVYDLCFDWTTGGWTLARVLD